MLYSYGKETLLKEGWTSNINRAYLYNTSGEVITYASATFTCGTDGILYSTSSIVFSVPEATYNVSYVEIGKWTDDPDGEGPGIAMFTPYYKETLDEVYDFINDGTVTVQNFTIYTNSSYMTALGAQVMFTAGLLGINTAKLYATDTLIDTETITMAWDSVSEKIEANATIEFTVPAGTNGINKINLLNAGGTLIYTKPITTYNYLTDGYLRVTDLIIGVTA